MSIPRGLTLCLANAFSLIKGDMSASKAIKQIALQCHTLLLPGDEMDVTFADFIAGQAGAVNLALKVREEKTVLMDSLLSNPQFTPGAEQVRCRRIPEVLTAMPC